MWVVKFIFSWCLRLFNESVRDWWFECNGSVINEMEEDYLKWCFGCGLVVLIGEMD